jgi:hypothetical protein
MATRNGSPELVLRTIGGCMDEQEKSLNVIVNRIVTNVEIIIGGEFIEIETHDGHVIHITGVNLEIRDYYEPDQ